MPGLEPRTLSLSLTRDLKTQAWTHWNGNPLDLEISLADADFTGATLLRAEVLASRRSATPLRYAEAANPTTEPTTLSFSGSALNLADPGKMKVCWLVIVLFVGGEKHTLVAGTLTLQSDSYSGDEATTDPDGNNWATQTQIDSLQEAIAGISGASSHNELSGRNASGAHPMSAIEGLVSALAGKWDSADTSTGEEESAAGKAALYRTGGRLGGVHLQADGVQGESGGSLALLNLYRTFFTQFRAEGATDNRIIDLPDASGTVALQDWVTAQGYGDMLGANNLNELTNPTAARTNLELGTMAVAAASDYLSKAGNLSGLTSVATARGNLGLGTGDTPDFAGLSLSADVYLRRKSAANFAQGAADAAAPVSQYLSVQNVAAGTSNTAGAARYLDGSQSTGSAAGGSIIFRTAAGGGSGTAQNALANVLTLSATKLATFTGSINLDSSDGSFNCNYNGTQFNSSLQQGGLYMYNNGSVTWAASATNHASSRDTKLARAAAGFLGLYGVNTSTGAGMELLAISTPSAPAASKVRIYSDTSGGKVRLMALFPTGAAQQIAIEP